MPKTIAIANDHAGMHMKNAIVSYLETLGYTVRNFGTDSDESVDYSDYADAVANALKSEGVDFGILLCGTGIGMSMAANRHRHIRAALCQGHIEATLTRQHNNANVLVMGARLITMENSMNCVSAFLNTDFAGGRHQRRIAKIS